jgi:hypothetical protein
MHVENDLVEFGTAVDQEYEEIVEEYEEEIFVPEEFVTAPKWAQWAKFAKRADGTVAGQWVGTVDERYLHTNSGSYSEYCSPGTVASRNTVQPMV